MLKKYLIISVINLFIGFSVFVSENRIKNLVYEKIMPDDKYVEYVVNEDIFSKAVISQNVSEDFANEYDKYGIKFKYPNGWEVTEIRGNKCFPSDNRQDGRRLCIQLKHNITKNILEIKSIYPLHDVGGGIIVGDNLKNGLNKSLETFNGIKILRSNSIDTFYKSEYGQNIIVLAFIKNLFIYPKDDEYIEAYGNESWWLLNDNNGVLINYILDNNEVEFRNNVINNATMKTLDEIVSTLEINFNEMEF